MKTLILFLISILSTSYCYATANALTQAFLNVDGNSGVFILSAKRECLGPLSSRRSSEALTYQGGEVLNVYISQKDCETAGGVITQEEREMQLISLITQAQSARDKAQKQAEAKNEQVENEQKFFGINFGVGLAFTFLNDPIVSDVTIGKLTDDEEAKNRIFVNHQSKNRAVALLESHYFFEKSLISAQPSKEWGHGPFMAIGLAGEEGIDPLSTYGGGWMWGFMRDDGSSFNIGLGIFIDTKAILLRPEYSDQAETELTNADLLTYKRDRKGWMLMFSSSF